MARKKALAPGAEERIASYIRTHLGQTLGWRTLDELCGTRATDAQYGLVVQPLLADGVLHTCTTKLHSGSAARPILNEYRICEELPSELPASAALWEAAHAQEASAANTPGAADEDAGAHGAEAPEPAAATGDAPDAPARKRTCRGGRRHRKAGADQPGEATGTDQPGDATDAESTAPAPAAQEADAPAAPATQAAAPAPVTSEASAPAQGGQRQRTAQQPKQAAPKPSKQQPKRTQQRALAQPKPAAALPSPLDTLNPQLTRNGYLAGHPSAAKAWRRELQALSQWLDAHPQGAAPALEEERSFEVFGNEKLLNQRGQQRGGISLGNLVKGMGVLGALAVEEVPVELRAYAPDVHRRLVTVLIVENHCPYLRISDAMKEGQRSFFGRHIDALVYGEGSRVNLPGTLTRTQESIARDATFKYLYWGDIDREGIAIYERLQRDAGIDLELLLPAYTAMLDAVDPQTLPLGGKGSSIPPHAGISLATKLNEQQLETYIRVMMLGLRIPQEAVPVESYCHPRATLSAVAQTARALPRKLPRLPWQR